MPYRVAVVVRTKDRPYFLRRALADVAAQSFHDAVVIVVNDNDGIDGAPTDALILDKLAKDVE